MSNLLGNAFILGALVCGAFGFVVGMGAGMRRSEAGRAWVQRAVYGYAALMALANGTMVYALVTHDFSVGYVAQVGSRATPLVFTVVSLWSALEGSILLWGLILAGYALAFAVTYRREHRDYMSYALAVMLGVGAFFAFILAGPAAPFYAVSPVPLDGPGPNPLLQNHILMVIHPPMLYLGYVGMTVPFAVAAAALLRGELNHSWMKPLRRWTMVAWTFLSVGIIVGAWWAYAVLGWGGYWAWDPVENASFMPWLTATAFIHSTVVQERRRMLKVWTLALALFSFVLTLLGTFMTRSGVFNSVHSFTQSAIGPVFLGFIAVCLVASVLLLVGRGPLLADEGRIQSALSRDTAFFVNNLLLVAFTFTVLIGTVYPLVAEAVRGVRVSVGGPYFNKMALPIAVGVLFLMGVGPALPWGEARPGILRRQLLLPFLAGAAVAGICFWAGARGGLALATFGAAGFVTFVTAMEMLSPALQRMRAHKESFVTAFVLAAFHGRRRFGGYVVHLGVVVVAVGVAASSSYVAHAQKTLAPGESFQIGRYTATFKRLAEVREPHRTGLYALMEMSDPSGRTFEMRPRTNYYPNGRDPVGSPDVRGTFVEDLYLTLLAWEKDGSSVTLNAWVFPLVGWIWGAIPIFVIGSLISLWPSWRRKESAVEVAAEQAPGAKLPGVTG